MHFVKAFLERYSMQYFGGKNRIAKQIGDYLNSIRKEGQNYYEPFVGGASIIGTFSGKWYGGYAN